MQMQLVHCGDLYQTQKLNNVWKPRIILGWDRTMDISIRRI